MADTLVADRLFDPNGSVFGVALRAFTTEMPALEVGAAARESETEGAGVVECVIAGLEFGDLLARAEKVIKRVGDLLVFDEADGLAAGLPLRDVQQFERLAALANRRIDAGTLRLGNGVDVLGPMSPIDVPEAMALTIGAEEYKIDVGVKWWGLQWYLSHGATTKVVELIAAGAGILAVVAAIEALIPAGQAAGAITGLIAAIIALGGGVIILFDLGKGIYVNQPWVGPIVPTPVY